jgi:hypothetical protein
MGLLDSLFGQRSKYNSDVDSIIRNHLMIETNNSINPKWPGSFSYLQEIDIGWRNKYNPYECAVMCGVDYLSGNIRKHDVKTLSNIIDELGDVGRRIRVLIEKCGTQNLIREELVQGFSKYLNQLGNEMAGKISLSA